jgi:hypothetical protein
MFASEERLEPVAIQSAQPVLEPGCIPRHGGKAEFNRRGLAMKRVWRSCGASEGPCIYVVMGEVG